MRERRSGRMILALAVIAVVIAIPAKAAPPGQESAPEPTPTPTPTQGRVPSQPTPITQATAPTGPTATLIAPPDGGGRVAAEALYVRNNPSFEGVVIGTIAYNQSLYPIGRNANNTWVAINWSDATGWVYAGLVVWDPNLNFETLPVLAPANLTPLPSETASATAGTPGVTASPAVTSTKTAAPSPTPRPTRTLAPTVTTRPATSATSAPPSPTPTVPLANTSPPPSLLDSLPPCLKTGGGIALGAVVLLGGGYLARRITAQREVTRYRGGFPLTLCPVCLEGHVHVNEVVKTSLGIPRLTRSVRCDNCHSALREVQPGKWRYSVDAYRNPEMAERYGTRLLWEDDLKKLAEQATEERFDMELEKEQTLQSQIDLSWLDVSYDDPPDSEDETPSEDTGTGTASETDQDDESR